MIKKRLKKRTKKTTPRKKMKKPPKTPPARGSIPEPLTRQEMLSRVPNRDLLTTKELQRIFGDCHVQTIYRYVQKGYLTPQKVWGRASRYKRSDVLAFIDQRYTPTPKTR